MPQRRYFDVEKTQVRQFIIAEKRKVKEVRLEAAKLNAATKK